MSQDSTVQTPLDIPCQSLGLFTVCRLCVTSYPISISEELLVPCHRLKPSCHWDGAKAGIALQAWIASLNSACGWATCGCSSLLSCGCEGNPVFGMDTYTAGSRSVVRWIPTPLPPSFSLSWSLYHTPFAPFFHHPAWLVRTKSCLSCFRWVWMPWASQGIVYTLVRRETRAWDVF